MILASLSPQGEPGALGLHSPTPAEGKEERRRLLHRLAALLATLIAASMLAALAVTALNTFGCSADALYLPALYRDLASGTPVRYWRLPAVPGFLPDMPLMFGALWATGQDILLSFALYGIVYALLLAAAIVYLIWGLVRPRWSHPFIVLTCLSLWAGIMLTNEDSAWLLMLVVIPSFHSGAILVGTFLLACTVRLLERPWPKALPVVWVLAAAGGIASDPFFLVQFFVPILLCMYLFRRRKAFPGGVPLRTSVLLAVSSALIARAGLAVLTGVFHLTGDAPGALTIQLTGLSPVLAQTYGQVFKPIMKGNLVICIFTVLGFLLAAAMLLRHRRFLHRTGSGEAALVSQDHHVRVLFCMLFFVVSGGASLLFPILSGVLTSVGMYRYIEPVYVFPAVILAVFLSLLTAARNRMPWFGVTAVLSVALVVLVAIGGRKLLPRRLAACQPAKGAELDELYSRMGVTNGLGEYWIAKPVSLLSRCGVHVDQFLPWQPHRHINNLYWYLQPGPAGTYKLRKYEFIVPFLQCPVEWIVARFGPPVAVFNGPTVQALIYSRKSDIAFRNFLRTRVLYEMGRLPPSRVKSPPGLGEYKVEGLPYNSPGCSIIPAGESLEVVFDPPAQGDVLEICADNNDEYEVQVRYVDGRREVLKLPVVPVSGLGGRFVSLSSPDGIPKVQGLTIRPVAGDGVYSIGHVFVYEDNW